MGVSYFYVNHDKQQFFYSGLFGWNSRFTSLGCGPGARALGIVLSDGGLWRGDRISAIGDSSDDYCRIARSFSDVEIEAELMLIDHDGLEWIELQDNIIAFTRMCDYATYFRRQDIASLLDKTFGAGKWHRRYTRHRQTGNNWDQKVADAASRELHPLWVRPASGRTQ